jgi:hypothetical protein
MPPSASQHPAAPSASVPRWIAGSIRSLHKLIGQGAEGPSGQDWASSSKARPKSRRPVWE